MKNQTKKQEKRNALGQTEEEFLQNYRSDRYPKPSLTADLIVIDVRLKRLLLIQRRNFPFMDCWAFPGGFVNANERVEEAAMRELKEETGLALSDIQLLGVYSAPGRDPRGWVVSCAYIACVDSEKLQAKAADDAADVQIFTYDVNKRHDTEILLKGFETFTVRVVEGKASCQSLAFDHAQMLVDTLAKLQELA